MKVAILICSLAFSSIAYSQDLTMADLNSKYELLQNEKTRMNTRMNNSSYFLNNSAELRIKSFNHRFIGAGFLLLGSLIQINSAARIAYPTTLTVVSPYAMYAAGVGFSISSFINEKESNDALKNAAINLKGYEKF